MSIDLSALLGGGDGPDLKDALTSMTDSGDLLFQKPFGDSTLWRTKTGTVAVAVIFDPFLPWGKANLLASTTPNYMQDVRRALGEYLIPNDIAPTKASLSHTIWENIIAKLPEAALDTYLQDEDPETKKPRVIEYVKLLSQTVTEQYNEEEAFMKALSEKDFSFTYHLAVDMYPQEKTKNDKKTAGKKEKLGVLVFNFQGRPGAVDETPGKVGVDTLKAEGKTPPPSPRQAANGPCKKPSLRRHASDTSKKDQVELEALLSRLELNPEKLEQGCVSWAKDLPDSSSTFFEQVGAWFSCLLSRKQSQLERAKDGNVSPMMYR